MIKLRIKILFLLIVLMVPALMATTEKGKILVIKAGTVFEKLGENDLKERTFASPAVSGSALFIRTESQLYRIKKVQ